MMMVMNTIKFIKFMLFRERGVGGGDDGDEDNDVDEIYWIKIEIIRIIFNNNKLGNEELVEEMMGKGRVLGGLTAQVVTIIII